MTLLSVGEGAGQCHQISQKGGGFAIESYNWLAFSSCLIVNHFVFTSGTKLVEFVLKKSNRPIDLFYWQILTYSLFNHTNKAKTMPK